MCGCERGLQTPPEDSAFPQGPHGKCPCPGPITIIIIMSFPPPTPHPRNIITTPIQGSTHCCL